jgi:hypothetical protein
MKTIDKKFYYPNKNNKLTCERLPFFFVNFVFLREIFILKNNIFRNSQPQLHFSKLLHTPPTLSTYPLNE